MSKIKTIEEVREEANKYIAKNLELFNQEPTYSQVIGFVVKPILHDYAALKSQNERLEEICKEHRRVEAELTKALRMFTDWRPEGEIKSMTVSTDEVTFNRSTINKARQTLRELGIKEEGE